VKNVPRDTPKAKALFDFDGEFDDELSFKVSLCRVFVIQIVNLLLYFFSGGEGDKEVMMPLHFLKA